MGIVKNDVTMNRRFSSFKRNDVDGEDENDERPHALRRGQRHYSRRLSSASGQSLTDYNDGEYTANITIGDPPQAFTVLLDFNTDAFWVPDKTCANSKCPAFCVKSGFCTSLCDPRCCKTKMSTVAETGSSDELLGDCGWRRRFDSSKSRTYRPNGTHFADLFGDTDVDGFAGVDTLRLGNGLMIPSQTFGQATGADFDADDAYDGILGLGERLVGLNDSIPGLPPLYQAKALGLIARTAVTVALKRDGPNAPDLPGGTVTYGDTDDTNCGSLMYYGSIQYGATSLVLETISLGATQATPPAGVQWTADFGIGALTLVGPSSVVQPFAASVGAVANSDGIYTIACNASVPPLSLMFSGTRYQIPSSELVRAFPTSNGTKCYLDIFDDIPYNTDFFSVGAAFARQYCLSFDYDTSRIGIGTNLFNRE